MVRSIIGETERRINDHKGTTKFSKPARHFHKITPRTLVYVANYHLRHQWEKDKNSRVIAHRLSKTSPKQKNIGAPPISFPHLSDLIVNINAKLSLAKQSLTMATRTFSVDKLTKHRFNFVCKIYLSNYLSIHPSIWHPSTH